MRELDEFNEICYWFLFQFIGDDVIMKFFNEFDIVSGLKFFQCGIIMCRIYNKIFELDQCSFMFIYFVYICFMI